MPSTATDDQSATSAWRTLRWTSLAVFVVLLDATILFVAFPSLRGSFPTVSAGDLSWVLNAYTVVYAALLVPAGRIADRVGRRRVFLQGMGVFTIGSLACGVAPTPFFITAGRVLQATGGAMLTPSSLALILNAFPRAKWPVAVSLWSAVGALAAAVGPSAGAAIVQFGGWRWAFFINLPVGLLAVIRGRTVLVESRDSQVEGVPDVIGVGLLVLGISLMSLAMIKTPEWTGQTLLICLMVGTISLGWFVFRCATSTVPALDLSLFRLGTFRHANAATFVFGSAFSAMWLGSVLFLTNVWGYDTTWTGLSLTPAPLLVVVVAPLAGRLASRFGQRPLLVCGGTVFGLGFLLRYAATSASPHYLTEWLPVAVCTGVGVGLVLPSLASASAQGLPVQRFAVGAGVNQAVRQIGSVLGVSVAVTLVGTARGAAGLPAFANLFLFLALSGFLTALISLAVVPADARLTANS